MKEIPSSLRGSVRFWVARKVFLRKDNLPKTSLLGDLTKVGFWTQSSGFRTKREIISYSKGSRG